MSRHSHALGNQSIHHADESDHESTQDIAIDRFPELTLLRNLSDFFRDNCSWPLAWLAFIMFLMFSQVSSQFNTTVDTIRQDGRMLQAKSWGWNTKTAISLIESLNQTELAQYKDYSNARIPLITAALNTQWMVVSLSVLIPEEAREGLGWVNLLPFVVGIAELAENFSVKFLLSALTAPTNQLTLQIIAAGTFGGIATLIKHGLGGFLSILIIFRAVTVVYNAWVLSKTNDVPIPQPPPTRVNPSGKNQKKSVIDHAITGIAKWLAETTTREGTVKLKTVDAAEFEAGQKRRQDSQAKAISSSGKKKKSKKND